MLKNINSDKLRTMFAGGAKLLQANKAMVDTLNVFPVPDGDTGTNMSLTMTSAINEVKSEESNFIEDVAKAFAHGALKGARGNSGVILSQIFKGFAVELENAETITTKKFSTALKSAADVAYQAVTKPKEGTILTVIRVMAEESQKIAAKNQDFIEFFKQLLEKGEEILQKTPDMLPVLKKAGVVDAGGRGLMCIFTGFYNVLAGIEIPEEVIVVEKKIEDMIVQDEFTDIEDIKFAYCTEFFIIHLKPQVTEAIIDQFREKLMKIGDCVLVIGDVYMVKVHVHTNNPNLALQFALELGELDKLKIENMLEQNRNIAKAIEKPKKKFGMVSICAGDGITSIFKDLRVDSVIEGGQTMNPSVADIINAVNSVNAENVIVFPNNKNIILAAEQAKDLCDNKCFVVPTANIPQGVAAAIAFNEAVTIEENIALMQEAIKNVKCGQVTYAIRTTKMDGFDLKEGDIIGLDDKKIIAKGKTVEEVCSDVISKMVDDASGIITLYYGEGVKEGDAEKFKDKLEKSYPELDVALYYGGQPHYFYLISIE